MATATVRIRGNATEAIAAVQSLGIKTETVGKEMESKMGAASSKIGGMFAKLGEQAERFGFEAGAAVSAVGDHMAETEVKGKGFANTLAGIGKAALLGVGAGAAVLAKFGISAELAAQKVDAQLKVAVENTGHSFEAFEPQVKAADAKMRQFGFTNNETNTALTNLIRGLGSTAKAQQLMGVAADLARSKNIDLSTASTLVMKASEGQTRALKQLGIDLPVYAGGAQAAHVANLALTKAQQNLNFLLQKTPDAVNPASKAHIAYEKAVLAVHNAQVKLHATQASGATIIAALEKRVHGAADAYGKTFAGQVATAKAQMDNMGEAIGKKLLPILTNLMEKTEHVVGWLSKHKDAAIALAGVVGGVLAVAVGVKAVTAISSFGKEAQAAAATLGRLGSAMLGLGAASDAQTAEVVAGSEAQSAGWFSQAAAATAAFVAENAATLGIAAGIAALIGVAIYAATHWKQVWGAIKSVCEEVWAFLKPVFTEIGTVIQTVIGSAIRWLGDYWKAEWTVIRVTVSTVWDALRATWNAIREALSTVIGAAISGLRSLWNTEWSAIRSVVTTAWNVVSPVFTSVKNALTTTIGGAISALSKSWSTIWGGIQSTVTSVWNTLKPVFSAMSSAISTVTSGVSSVASLVGLGGGHSKKPKHHADGGFAPRGELSIVGERGPELFIPDSAGVVIPHDLTAAILAGRNNGSSVKIGAASTGTTATRGERIDEMATAMKQALQTTPLTLANRQGALLRTV